MFKIKKFFHDYLAIRKFINHNKKYFPFNKKGDGEILIEFNAFHPSHISLAYVSNVIKKNKESQIKAYFNYSILSSDLNQTFLNKIKWSIGNFFSLRNFGIYKSFGVSNIFKPIINREIENEAEAIYKELYPRIKNKKDILNITIDNVLLGDLIYDTYLKSKEKPTLNINDDSFKNLFLDILKIFLYWKKYFIKNKVNAILGVHSVYSYGIPLRVAIKYNVPTYVLNPRMIYKLDKKMMRMSGDFHNFPEEFKKIPKSMQIKGKDEAKKRLSKTLSGIPDIEVYLHLTEKNRSNNNHNRLIKESSKIKILVCTHDFFDAVHAYGDLVFCDFYEWLVYLGELSKKTEYDWYIKNHPKEEEGRVLKYQLYTENIINKFINKYEKFNLLPDKYPHQKIVEEGIDFVLTGYGSVGVEYPLLNIPVINATVNNPHTRYKFNFHPQNINEYEKLLKNLDNLKLEINKDEIYEFYFMRHIFPDSNWLIEDLKELMNYVSGWDGLFTVKMYKYWMKIFNPTRHEEIIQNIESFLKSNDTRINIRHTKNFKKYI